MTNSNNYVGVSGKAIDRTVAYIKSAIGKKSGAVATAFKDLMSLLKNHRDAAILIAAFLAVICGAAVDRYRKNRAGLAFGLVIAAQEAIGKVAAAPATAAEYTAQKAFALVHPPSFTEDGSTHITALQEDITNLNQTLLTTQAALVTARARIAVLEDAGGEGDGSEEDAEMIARLIGEKSVLADANRQLTADLAEAEGALDAKAVIETNLRAELSEANADVVALTTQLQVALEASDPSGTIATLTAQVATMEATNLAQTGQVTALEAAIAAANAEIMVLGSSYATIAPLTAERNSLLSERDALAAQVSMLGTTVGSLTWQVADLQSQISNMPSTTVLQGQVHDLNTQLAAANTSYLSISNDLTAANAQIAQLQAIGTQISGYQATITSLETQVADLQAQLAALQP